MKKHQTIVGNAYTLYSMATSTERLRFWTLCVLSVLMGCFEIAVAGAVSLLGVALASPETLANASLMQAALQALPFQEHPQTLRVVLLVLLFVLGTTVAKNVLLTYIVRAQHYFGQTIGWGMSKKLFLRYMTNPYLWHTEKNSATLLAVLDWRDYAVGFVVAFMTLFTQFAIVIFLMCGALFVNATMSLFLFVCVGTIGFLVQTYVKRKVYSLSKSLYSFRLQCSRIAMQSLHGIREAIIYDKRKKFSHEYEKDIPRAIACSGSLAVYPSIPQWILECVGMALLLAVFCIEIFQGAGVAQVTGTLTMLAAVSWRLLPAANKITAAALSLRREQAGLEPLMEVLGQEAAASTLEERQERSFSHTMQLDGVSFTYPEAQRPALDAISMTISKKQAVGLVGMSGSGKSTLTGIIAGLLYTNKGQLLLDGTPWDPKKERLSIGYVPQHLYLLDASLAENIAFSRWKEPIDEARIYECCRMAAIDFLDGLSDGIHTVLGERGVRLSGGQVQRIGIARALYSNPEVLIFDEATSALDGATENEIQSTIYSLQGSLTLIIIAHRLSTVAGCDTVYWIDGGKIVESGPPEIVLPHYEAVLHSRTEANASR